MANGGPVNEYWGQGFDGGGTPVSGVDTSRRVSMPSAPPAAPAQQPSIASGPGPVSVDIPAAAVGPSVVPMSKPKALPRPKQPAADASGNRQPAPTQTQSSVRTIDNLIDALKAKEPKPQSVRSAQQFAQRGDMPIVRGMNRVGQELAAVARGANSKITYKPAEDAPSIYRGLGMANGGKVGKKC